MNIKFWTYALTLVLAFGPLLACNKTPVVTPPLPGATPAPNTAELTFQRLAALIPTQGKATAQIAILLNQEKRPNGEPYLSEMGLADFKAKLKAVLEDAQTASNKLDTLPAAAEAQQIIDCTVDILRLVNTLNAVSALPANFKTGLQHVVNWAEQLAASAKLLLPLLKQKAITIDANGVLTLPQNSVPLSLTALDQLDKDTSQAQEKRDLQTLLIGLSIIIAGTVNDTRLTLKEAEKETLKAWRKQRYETVFPLLN